MMEAVVVDPNFDVTIHVASLILSTAIAC